MTYYAEEIGGFWLVSDESGIEITRYRKDEIAWSGFTDIGELRREIREDLQLTRDDRLVVCD